MDINTEIGERLDSLGNDYFIIQNKNYFLFGIDSVLLADFSSKFIKPKSKIAEIGTGSGIIPILLTKRVKFAQLDAFEIQKPLVELAKRNIDLNNIKDKINIFNFDIKDYRQLKQNSYNIVISNPPYFPLKPSSNSKRRTVSENKSLRIARSEEKVTLSDLFSFSRWVLKQGGKFILVYRPDRLTELIDEAIQKGFEVKVLRFVYSTILKDAVLVLVEATKGAKPGLIVKRPLIIYDNNNEYTNEINLIYEGISRKK